jgi:hypothetical protein
MDTKYKHSINKRPPVRLTPSAHKHLTHLYEIYNRNGRSRNMTDIASEAILAIPIPNGNHKTPCEEPVGVQVPAPVHEEEK